MVILNKSVTNYISLIQQYLKNQININASNNGNK